MSSHYIHGTDAAEQRRLSTLNVLLNERCLLVARLNPGDRIIDLGAGLGQFSRAMARATGERVVGIERSAEQIGEAETGCPRPRRAPIGYAAR
jgi:cyclopropane fatty-acyl-phospholipid synthase-like methyltransferase